MAENEADKATPKTAETKPAEQKAAAKPRKPRATKASTAKSAGEGDNISASAPAVANEVQAHTDPNTLSAQEATDIVKPTGETDPFQDVAPPVGAALDAVVDPDAIDTTVDFPTTEAFTEIEGDVQVSVRQQNNRNIVELSTVGWTGPGQVIAPYQAKLMIKALERVVKKLA